MILVNNSNGRNNQFELLNLFEDFLSFWLDLRDRIEHHYLDGVNLKTSDGTSVNNVPRFIQSQLLAFSKAQQKLVEENALPVQRTLYTQMLYSVSALIDEQLLQQVQWRYQTDWLPLMLETAIFGSKNSGEKLITRMQSMSKQQSDFTKDEKDLAACYCRILWLGFDGKFRQQPELLEELKYQLIKQADLIIPDLSQQALFPQALSFNVNPETSSRLAPLKRWKRYLYIGIAIYLIISGIVWQQITNELDEELSIYESSSGK